MSYEVTGLDTNVVIAALNPKDAHHENAVTFLDGHASDPMVLPAAVYSELLAAGSAELVRAFLEEFRLRPTFAALDSPAVWELAAERFGLYVKNRKRSGGGQPRRILTDFIIGAQLVCMADGGYAPAIASLDVRFYRSYFDELIIHDLA